MSTVVPRITVKGETVRTRNLVVAAAIASTLAITTAAAATTPPASGGTAAAAAEPDAANPIVIGAAMDGSGAMAPVDGPALAAAKLTVDKINAEGGVLGRKLVLEYIDTKLDPAGTKAAAVDLITKKGAKVLLTTCDVDFATPAVQEGIDAGLLTIAPCIGTDQMGPLRFGDKGKLAFSMGNVAQDEGAVLAELAIERGYKTAIVVPDNLLVYFQNVCSSFKQRFEEKGGKVISEEGFTSFDQSVNNVATIVTGAGAADVITMCTFSPDITAAFKGIRDAGVTTPILGPWSGDGTYWMPSGLSNYTYVTYASVFGDDPDPAVNDLIAKLTAAGAPPASGGFVTGAAAIEAIAKAITEVGDTDGAKLAAAFEGFKGLDATGGKISFSAELHSVSGREYRVMNVTDSKPVFEKLMAASSPAQL